MAKIPYGMAKVQKAKVRYAVANKRIQANKHIPKLWPEI